MIERTPKDVRRFHEDMKRIADSKAQPTAAALRAARALWQPSREAHAVADNSILADMAEVIERETLYGEMAECLRQLVRCPAMFYTSYSGNVDRGENIKHVQCVCCGTDKGALHLVECHIAAAERLLSRVEGK